MPKSVVRKRSSPRKAAPRRKPSPAVRQLVLVESGYKCGNPTCRAMLTLQLHHIEWVKDGGLSDPGNLLPLCGYCHDLHTQGRIPAEAIRVWKGILVSLSSGTPGAADLLLHLSRMQSDRFAKYFAYNAGDLLPLAPLLNAGLVHADFKRGHSGGSDGPTASFEVRLTDRGEALVAAWKSGQGDALTAALAHTAA